MKICRFDSNRVGIIRNDSVFDITDIVKRLPDLRWPVPLGDQFIAQLEALRPEMERLADRASPRKLASVKLLSPVANPGKIVGAPINYNDHIAEAMKDQTIAHGRDLKTIGETGMFLKANSSLVGPSEGVVQRFSERRNDHRSYPIRSRSPQRSQATLNRYDGLTAKSKVQHGTVNTLWRLFARNWQSHRWLALSRRRPNFSRHQGAPACGCHR